MKYPLSTKSEKATISTESPEDHDLTRTIEELERRIDELAEELDKLQNETVLRNASQECNKCQGQVSRTTDVPTVLFGVAVSTASWNRPVPPEDRISFYACISLIYSC